MEKFIIFDDWLDFILVNRKKIVLKDFRSAYVYSNNNLAAISQLIPKGSSAHFLLKSAFDKKYFPYDAPRGIYYSYLLKVASGFASVWAENNNRSA